MVLNVRVSCVTRFAFPLMKFVLGALMNEEYYVHRTNLHQFAVFFKDAKI